MHGAKLPEKVLGGGGGTRRHITYGCLARIFIRTHKSESKFSLYVCLNVHAGKSKCMFTEYNLKKKPKQLPSFHHNLIFISLRAVDELVKEQRRDLQK